MWPDRYLPSPKRCASELIPSADMAQQNPYIHSIPVALCDLLKGSMVNTKKDYIEYNGSRIQNYYTPSNCQYVGCVHAERQ